jgi:hypothetical protein
MAEPSRRDVRRLPVRSLGRASQNAENFRQATKPVPPSIHVNTGVPTGAAPDRKLRWWDRNPVVRTLAAEGARQAALPLGAARGAVHSAEGLIGGAVFAERLANPQLDEFLSPPGMSARDDLNNAVQGAVDYLRTSPRKKIVRDVGRQLGRFRARVDPTATPAAPTLMGEIERNARIGMNQGELVFDVGSTLYGGEAVEGIAGLAGLSKVATPAKYLARGYSPELSRYLASPLPEESMGHHFWTRAAVKKTPALIRPVARAVSESRFSVLKPKGMSRGDFYQLHYNVDPSYYGGKAGKAFGAVKWSGKKLGWQKYGLLGRVVHGSPAPLKAAVISPSLTIAGAFVNRPKPNGATQ